ncbi:sugar transferase [Nostoc sp. UHCC 0302]|uniref:sugar transferase n=1 Tax=Nostoc sp. UHCC 0302 TaxID=3134896 RepID=UPI00311C8DC0
MINKNCQSNSLKKISKFIKSILDRFVAAIALIILSPVLLSVAIAVYINMGSPILFTQKRPGKDTRIFTCYKFRTMTDLRGTNGKLLPDTERLTNLGKFLRKTSLDELPQLWSVLKGDMSFIGPRPLLIEYLPYYSERERKRHSVLPGITGLAQINGRNRLLWEDRLEFDIQYVEKQSLALDFYILFMTVWKVIARSDIDIHNLEGNFAKSRQQQLGLPIDSEVKP